MRVRYRETENNEGKSKPVSAQDVYDYVRNKIIAKELFPGRRIIEEELAEQLHTSRTTVRSGISRLNYDGLVEVKHNRGTFVAQPNLVDMNDVYAVRSVLEKTAAQLAMSRITETGLQRMEASIEQLVELEKNYSMAKFAKINQSFHWEIIQAAGNVYLEKYLRELFNRSIIFLIFYDESHSGKLTIQTHRAILEAMRKKDEAELLAAIQADNDMAKDCLTLP